MKERHTQSIQKLAINVLIVIMGKKKLTHQSPHKMASLQDDWSYTSKAPKKTPTKFDNLSQK